MDTYYRNLIDSMSKLDNTYYDAKIIIQKKVDDYMNISLENRYSLGWPICIFDRNCESGNTFNECKYHSRN